MADKAAKGRQLRGEGIACARLTRAEVADIRTIYAAGATLRELGLKYGVHRATVRDVVRRKTWAHVA